ncbi:MAG: PilN domain-containing protein, partial [Candidatus Omnitrophica bacterium]|nr:PilN domain-containing protein [Candidatus Omnitrophota bacterium]
SLNVPRERIIQALGGLVIFLIFIHVILQGLITMQAITHKKYQREAEDMGPASIKAQAVIQEVRKLQGKVKSVHEVVGEKKIFWSQKLNAVSDQIPRGVWLTKIHLDENDFLIYGSSVSKNKDKMVGIHQFVADLKKNPSFLKNFKRIDLRIEDRMIQSTEIADFTISVEVEKIDNKRASP